MVLGTPRLVATDLDGTLLNSRGAITQRTREVLRALDARYERIAVGPIPDTGLGEAINDRLQRAAYRED